MMKCLLCEGTLEILRMCSRIRMRCKSCGKEYKIHEVASQLDEQTEKKLEQYTVLIYD